MRKIGLIQSVSNRRLSVSSRLGRSLLLVALLLPISASAQFFNDQPVRHGRQPAFGGFGFGAPSQNHQNPFGGFGTEFQHPDWPGSSRPPARPRVVRKPPPPRIDYSHAPPPEQQNSSAERRILVLGDAMADWLAYGLEQVVSEQTDLAVVRKINTESGLLKYPAKKGEAENWVAAAKQIIAAEKADAIVVMLGLRDRIAVRETAPTVPAPKATGEVGWHPFWRWLVSLLIVRAISMTFPAAQFGVSPNGEVFTAYRNGWTINDRIYVTRLPTWRCVTGHPRSGGYRQHHRLACVHCTKSRSTIRASAINAVS